MHIAYIDESKDIPSRTFIFSALVIHSQAWTTVYENLLKFRRELREKDEIYVRKELHAWKFTSGRGQPGPKIVTKGRRCQIFKELLQIAADLPETMLFNSVVDRQDWALERLLNRINRTMQELSSHAVLVFDEGDEVAITRMVRRMRLYNFIPSKYGFWLDSGQPGKNIPLRKLIDDPFFRNSASSYFIQLADFCAYALMQKERPIASKQAYGLDKAFELLEPICYKKAHPNDPYGIIR
jgi:hypothetical protein